MGGFTSRPSGSAVQRRSEADGDGQALKVGKANLDATTASPIAKSLLQEGAVLLNLGGKPVRPPCLF
jgi:hypothetical protein